MSDYRTPQPCRSLPLQFGLRSIFVLTTMVAVLVAGVRFGGLVGALIAGFVVAAGTAVWADRTKHSVRFQVSVLVMVSIALYLFLLPAMQGVRKRTRSPCHNNLRQIGLALQNYADKHGRFPPAVVYDANGRPMHSWRTLILPEIEEAPLYHMYNFDEPWDSPYNKKVTQVRITCFQCPDDKQVGQFDTTYVALIGPDSIWSSRGGTKLNAVADGSTKTMIVVEMKNSGIHWAEPRDLDLDNLPPGIDKNKLGKALGSHTQGLILALYADGHVEAIPSDVTIDELKAVASKSGGDTVDFEKQKNRIVTIK